MMRKRSPYFSKERSNKLTSRLNSNPNTVIQEKIIGKDGKIEFNKYHKGSFLGKGGFAKVYEITDLATKNIDAVKIVEKASLKKSRAKQKLMSEIKIHNSLNHEGIVKFK